MDVTFHAHWSQFTYPIAYDMNGHGVVPSDAKTSYSVDDLPYTPEPAEDDLNDNHGGYLFKRWLPTSIPRNSTGAKIFVAQWEPTLHTIQWYSNWPDDDQIVDTWQRWFGEVLGGLPEGPEYKVDGQVSDDKVFDGWWDYDGINKAHDGTAISGDINFYAKWKIPTFYVRWISDGVIVDSWEQEKKTQVKGMTQKLPTKVGYDFEGWYLDNTLVTAENVNDFMVNSNMDFIAHWRARTIWVFISSNWHRNDLWEYIQDTGTSIKIGGNDYHTMGAHNLYSSYSDSDCRRIMEVTYDGDWESDFTIYDIAEAHKDEQLFEEKTKVLKQDVINNKSAYMRKVDNAQFPELYSAGYDITMWFDNSWGDDWSGEGGLIQCGDQGQPIGKVKVKSICNNQIVGIYAQWQLKTFKVTLDVNGGTFPEEEEESNSQYLTLNYEYNSELGELPIPTKKYGGSINSQFLGWYTEPSGGDKATSTTKVTKEITYYAHWLDVIQVTYRDNFPVTLTYDKNY